MDEVFRIVNGALRLDIGKVRNYTAFLADKLEQAGEGASAKRLRKLLEETDHTRQGAQPDRCRGKQMKKRGRKPGLVARRRAATTRLSADEYRAAQDLAYRRGLTLSTWLRVLILAALTDDDGAEASDG